MKTWKGKNLTAHILFSGAGVAQQIWVANKNGAVLFDVGDGTLRDILANKLDYRKIKSIVCTHGHFDHIGGLYSLLGYLRMKRRTEPLPIYLPKGCTEPLLILNAYIKRYQKSIPFKITYKEIKKFSIKEGGILEILASNYGNVVKKEIILEKLWRKNDYFAGRSMDVYISYLRKTFKDNKIKLSIKNIAGIGLILE